MNWAQITITTSEDASEAVGNYLFELGTHGVELKDSSNNTTSLTAYFPLDDRIDARVKKINAFLTELPKWGIQPNPAKIDLKRIASEEWAEAWKSDYHPQKIGNRFLVAPTWYDIPPESTDIHIRLDPGMAFGTGYHPTTRLSLRMLEQTLKPNQYVVDIGTGSGILTIAAVKLGARQVDAIELDETAIPIANTNFKINHIREQTTLSHGDGLSAVNRKYDLIIGNILTKVILPIIPYCPARMKPNGHVIFSGILESEQDVILEVLTENGMECIHVMHESEDDVEWVAIKARLTNQEN